MNTTKQQHTYQGAAELDEFGWRWALKLADLDRREYKHKQPVQTSDALLNVSFGPQRPHQRRPVASAATDTNCNSSRCAPHTHAMRPLELASLRRARVAAPNEFDGRKGLSARDDEGAPDGSLKPAARSARAASPKQPGAARGARGGSVRHWRLRWAWPHDGRNQTLAGAGIALAKQYQDAGLDMMH